MRSMGSPEKQQSSPCGFGTGRGCAWPLVLSAGMLACLQVGDFGLSIKMDHMETHISAVFQGTL